MIEEGWWIVQYLDFFRINGKSRTILFAKIKIIIETRVLKGSLRVASVSDISVLFHGRSSGSAVMKAEQGAECGGSSASTVREVTKNTMHRSHRTIEVCRCALVNSYYDTPRTSRNFDQREISQLH